MRSSFWRKVGRIAKYLVIGLAILYVGDLAVFQVRLMWGGGMGSVTAQGRQARIRLFGDREPELLADVVPAIRGLGLEPSLLVAGPPQNALAVTGGTPLLLDSCCVFCRLGGHLLRCG